MTATAPSQKPWADTPLALIPTPEFTLKKTDMFTVGASHMGMVHNSIFRGYNSIYHQAQHIADADKADFIGYCLTWHKFLKTHADNEEEGLFPRTEELLEDKTLYVESTKEHEAFEPGLEKFESYLVNLKSPHDFSGTALLELMVAFQAPLEQHMRAEISTIADLARHPRTPPAGSAEEKAARELFDKREGAALMKSGLTDVVPFFLLNFDRDFEEGHWADWPPIPAPVRWGILSVARLLHPGWWKFAACDSARRRIPLYAAPEGAAGGAPATATATTTTTTAAAA